MLPPLLSITYPLSNIHIYVLDIYHSNFNYTCSKLDDYYYSRLNITNNINDIYIKYDNYQYIVLRPYNGEKVLIIGCGNGRLDDGNCSPINEKEQEQDTYNKYHLHENAYTIDAELIANPSIVSEFNSTSTYTTIPDNSFDFIIFEGGGDPSDNPNEIKRLLNENNLSFCIDNSYNGYEIYSYYLRGKYNIIEQKEQYIEEEEV